MRIALAPGTSEEPGDETRPRREPAAFGEVFTDHMVTVRWSRSDGWHDAWLRRYEPIALDPAAQVFHYGQEIFEGLKAYRQADGSVAIFRPDANATRFGRSSERMAMPVMPSQMFVEALDRLVHIDRDWVPTVDGHSLYLRPFMIATQASLAFYGPSDSYLFVLIASPAGAYFAPDARPITVWVSSEYTRAAPDGTGAAKCGGNYAGTLLAHQRARTEGCDQVVWLDPIERRWIEEMGTSNIFFVYGERLVTPELSGSILSGITRDSLLTLARDLGYTVEEGRINLEDWYKDAVRGRLTEVFSCGTSSMITPIGQARWAGGDLTIGDGSPGPVTLRLRRELMGIHAGTRPDTHGWMHRVDPPDEG